MKGYRFISLVCGFMFMVFLSNVQAQEEYPKRTIEVVVPFSAGGSNDLIARMYIPKLTEVLRNQIIVVNRGAGGGVQGILYVSRAKKDGYTLLATGPSLLFSALVRKEATYDPLKSFVPLGNLGYTPMVCAVKSDSPFKTFGELVEYARKNPGKLKNGDGGGISTAYFNVELLRARDIQITIVPFTGGGEAVVALLGGHVDMYFSTFVTVVPHIKAGKLRALAMTGKKRIPLFPDIPTTAELGYPDVALTAWSATFAPSGIPQSAFNVLVQGLEKAFQDPEVIKRISSACIVPDYKGPEEFRRQLESEMNFIGKIVKDRGLQPTQD